jgi:flagellar biosynthesis protein FlhF
MSDALAKVKTDMGCSAVILHTRTVKRGGLFGIGARPFIEITATNDPRVAEARAALKSTEGPRPAISPAPSAASAPLGRRGTGVDAEIRSSSPASARRCTLSPGEPPAPGEAGIGVPSTQAAPSEPVAPTPIPASDPTIRKEIETIRDMVADLARRTERPAERRVPGELLDYYTHLISQDVAEELAVQVVERASGRLRTCPAAVNTQDGSPCVCPVGGDLGSPQRVQAELQRIVGEMLPEVEPLKMTVVGRPTIVALVGPTGVGKTTTIAKLAANAKLRECKSVGLITIDTYRIAAVEQLKVYAQILDVPLAAVVTPREMEAAVRRMSHLDLILIDTAGRSQRDEPRIAELGELLAVAGPDQVHLVLATTAREATIREAIARFSVLGVRQLIFTKIDEAVGFGVLLNVLDSVNLRLSYLTTGQSVPKDIEEADRGRIARLIVGEPSGSAGAPVRRPPRPIEAAAQSSTTPEERGV